MYQPPNLEYQRTANCGEYPPPLFVTVLEPVGLIGLQKEKKVGIYNTALTQDAVDNNTCPFRRGNIAQGNEVDSPRCRVRFSPGSMSTCQNGIIDMYRILHAAIC